MKKRTFWLIVSGLVATNLLSLGLAVAAMSRANAAHQQAIEAKLDFVQVGLHVNELSAGVQKVMRDIYLK